MKKSVVLTILIIYIIAIVVVGFIGIALKVYDEKKYVEQIECLTEGYVHGSVEGTNCDGYIEVQYKKNVDNLVIIKCRALPADATNTKLKLVVDKEKGYDVDNPPEDVSNYEFWYRDNGDGTWTINLLKGKSQRISVQPTDRAGVKLVILIEVKISGGGIVPPKA